MSLKSKKKKTAVSPLVRGSAAAGAAAQARAKKSAPKKQKPKQTVQPAKAAASKAPVAKKKTTATSASGRNDVAVRQSYGQRAGTRTSSGAYKPTQSAAYNYKKAETKRSTISTDIKNQTKVKTQKPSVVSGPVKESRDNRDKRMRQSWSQRHPENQVQREQRNEKLRPKSYVPTKAMAIPTTKNTGKKSEWAEFEEGYNKAGILSPNERTGIAEGPLKDRAPLNTSQAKDIDTMLSGGTVPGMYIPDDKKPSALEYSIRMTGQDALSKPYAEEIWKNASVSEKARILKAATETVGFNEQTRRWSDEFQREYGLTSSDEKVKILGQDKPGLGELMYRDAYDKYKSAVKQQEYVDKWAKDHGYGTSDYMADATNLATATADVGLMNLGYLPLKDITNIERKPGDYFLGGVKAPYEGVSSNKSAFQNLATISNNIVGSVRSIIELPFKGAYYGINKINPDTDRYVDDFIATHNNVDRINRDRDEMIMRMNSAVNAGLVGKKSQVAGNIEGFILQQIPAIATMIAAGPEASSLIGGTTFFGTTAGAYAQSALDSGASLEEAMNYGILGGIGEGATEMIFPMAKGIGGGLLKGGANTVNKRVLFGETVRELEKSGFANSMSGRILRSTIYNGGEATEEMIMEIIDPYLQRASFNPEAENASLAEIGMAGLYGAAVSAVLHIPMGMMNTAQGLTERHGLISNARLYYAAKMREELIAIRGSLEAGMITEEEAEQRTKEVRNKFAEKFAEAKTAIKQPWKATGSLLNEQTQGGEYKTSSNLEHLYSNRQEANAATVKPGTSAYFMEDGEVKRITHSEAGVKSEDAVLTNSEKTAYAEKAERLRTAKNNTERTGVQANVRQDIIDQASEMARVYNRNVEFYRDEEAAKRYDDRGRFDPKTETIYVNAATDKPLQTIVSHEMVHAMRNTNAFKELLQEIKTYYKDSYDADVNDIRRMYSERDENGNVIEPSESIIQEEVVAHFVEKKLLTDEAWVNTFLTNSRTDKILRGINTLLQRGLGGKEARFLASVRSKWLNALEEERGEQTAPRAEAVAAAKERRQAKGKRFVNKKGIRLPKDEYRRLVTPIFNAIYRAQKNGYKSGDIISVYDGGYEYLCWITDIEDYGYVIVKKMLPSERNLERMIKEGVDNHVIKEIVERHRLGIKESKRYSDRDIFSDSGITGNGRSVGRVSELADSNRSSDRSTDSEQSSGNSGSKVRRAKGSRDSEYLAAVERGDMATAQRLVDEAAEEAGYTVDVYHGTYSFGRTRFDLFGGALFLTDSVGVARNFSGGQPARSIKDNFDADTSPLNDVINYAKENTYIGDQLRFATIDDFDREADRIRPDEGLLKYGQDIYDSNVRMYEILQELRDDFLDGTTYLYMDYNSIGDDYANVPVFTEQTLREFVKNYKPNPSYSGGGVYRLVLRPKKMITINVNGGYYTDVPIPKELEKFATKEEIMRGYATSDQILRMANGAGYDTVKYAEMREGGDYGNAGISNVYATLNATENVKSADPITRDNNGEIILPSERFNEENDDIRYARGLSALDEEYLSAVKAGDMATAQRLVDEAAREAGYHPRHNYHGTLAYGFWVFDKAKAHVGGNSGAGFYFSTSKDDSDRHYADVNGADNYFKARELAEVILEAGEWRGFEIENYDQALEAAQEEINKNPGTYDVYLKYDKPYIRDYRNSTNLVWVLMDDFDETQIDRDDYDSEEDYETDLDIAKFDYVAESVGMAVRDAISDIEERYDVVDLYFNLDVLTSRLMESVYDLDFTWDDIIREISNCGGIDIANEDWNQMANGDAELARAIIENLGFDAIVDREVDTKFGQLMRDKADGEQTEHIIVFNPNQIKSADPVTRDNKGEIIPLSERFNPEENDIRYARGGRQYRSGYNAAKREQDKTDRATMREFDKLERQRAIDRAKQANQDRRDDEATMREFDNVMKKVRQDERKLSQQEKKELRKNYESREKDIRAEKNRLIHRLRVEKRSWQDAAERMESERKKQQRSLDTKQRQEMRKKQQKLDEERREERLQGALDAYEERKEEEQKGSAESLYKRNREVQSIIDDFRTRVLQVAARMGAFKKEGSLLLDHNDVVIAESADGYDYTLKRDKNVVPSFALTILAEQEGMKKEDFYGVYAELQKMQTERDEKGNRVYTKRDILEYIVSLKIPASQKSFLYFDVMKYRYDKKPVFKDGGPTKIKPGNYFAGELGEAIDRIGLDMFTGAGVKLATDKSFQIKMENVDDLLDMMFTDEEMKEVARTELVQMIADFEADIEEARMIEQTNLLTDNPKEVDSRKLQILSVLRDSKKLFLAEGEAFERFANTVKNPLLAARYYAAKASMSIARDYINGHGIRKLDGAKEKVARTKQNGDEYDVEFVDEKLSLTNIMKPALKGTKESDALLKDLTRYVYAQHNIDRMKYDKGFMELSEEECQAIIDEIGKNKQVVKMADDLVLYGQRLLRLCVESGVISEEDFEYFTTKYPHYVPTFRLREDEVFDRNGNIVKRTNKVIKEAQKSNADLIPLYDQMVRRTQEIVKACKKNQLAAELVKAYNKDGAWDYIIDVRPAEPTSGNEDYIYGIGQIEDRGLKNRDFDGEDNLIPVYLDGVKYNIAVADKNLLYGWDRLNYYRDETSIPKLLRKMNTLRRWVLTQYNPIFWATNGIKDSIDMYLYNQHAERLPLFQVKALSDIFHKKGHDSFAEYLSFGAASSSFFEYDERRRSKARKLKDKAAIPFKGIDFWNFLIEQWPRYTVYLEECDRLTKERKNGKNEYSDEEIKTISAYRAADATVNFGRSGTVVKAANTYGATFLNAGVQGMDRFRRMFTQVKGEKKQETLLNILGLMIKLAAVGLAPSMIADWLYGGNDDDEDKNKLLKFLFGEDAAKVVQEYAEMADYERTNYLNIKLPGMDGWIRIPKGRVVSFIYGWEYNGEKVLSGDMSAMDLLYTQWDLFAENIMPGNPLTNNILQPVLDVAKNRDFWGNEIVSQWEQAQDGFHWTESNEDTSIVARKIAEYLHYIVSGGKEMSPEYIDLSPIKIDYLLQQYGGSWTKLAQPFISAIGDGQDQRFVDMIQDAFKDSMWGKFYLDPVLSNRLAGDYYDLKDEYTGLSDYYGQDTPYAVALKGFKDHDEDLKALRDELNYVSKDASLTWKERLAKMREIREQMNDIYRVGVKDAKSILEYASDIYGGKDMNKDIYDAWQADTKGPDWVIDHMSDSAKVKWDTVKSEYSSADPQNFVDAYNYFSGLTGDKDENGKTVHDSKRQKFVQWLDNQPYSAAEKQALYTQVGGYKTEATFKDGGSGTTKSNKDALKEKAEEIQANTKYMPVKEARISSEFGMRTHPISGKQKMHTGIDIAVGMGTDVVSARKGVVEFAGSRGGYGNRVVIDHGDGMKTTYSHLSEIGVKPGDTVNAGTLIAKSGSTGASTGPHLHFEVEVNGSYVNPRDFFDFDSWKTVSIAKNPDYSAYAPTKSSSGGGGGRKSGGKKSGGSGKKGKATTSSETANYTPTYAPTTTRSSGSSGSSSGGSSGKSSSKATRTPAARRTQTSVAKGIMLPTAREIDSAKRTSTPTVARNGGKSASRGIVLPTAAEVASAAAGARIGYGSGTSSIRRTNRSRGSFWHENVLG